MAEPIMAEPPQPSPVPPASPRRQTPALAAAAITMDTAALTAAMAAGDEAAITSFYGQHFHRLYHEARRATGERDQAFCLDVVQDSLLRIVRTVRRVEDARQFAAWLNLVVRTTAYDLLRREARRRRHESMAAMPGVPRPST